MPKGMTFPVYGAKHTITFPITKTDGTLISGATGLDSNVDLDLAGFNPCTNEAGESGSTGIYSLTLTGTEMSAGIVTVEVKTSSTGAIYPVFTIYPRVLPTLVTGTATAGANGSVTLQVGASALDDYYNGCLVLLTNNDPAGAQYQCRTIVDYVGSTRVASIQPNWDTNPSSATTYTILVTEDWNMAQAVRLFLALPASALNNVAATDIVSNGAITTLTGAVVNVGTVAAVTGLTPANLDGKVTDAIAAPAAALVAVNLDHLVGTATGIPPLPTGTYLDGPIKSDLRSILGTALTETAGQIAAAFKKFFDKAAPTGTINSLPDALPSAASGLPLKSDLPAAAPTASTIAGAVLDEAKGAHTGLLAKALPDYVPSNINGLPIKSDLPAAAPDVNAIADQVWDEAIAGHLNPGSTGLALNTAGSAADPLTNPVPGTYAAGTAGAAIGSLQTGKITVVSPMSQDGLAVKLVRGDDYLNADGRALVWTDSGSNWPNLTGATVRFKWGIFTKTCTVIGAGGAHQQVSLDLTSAETDVMQNGYFDLEATLSNTHVVTLVIAGSLIIKDDV